MEGRPNGRRETDQEATAVVQAGADGGLDDPRWQVACREVDKSGMCLGCRINIWMLPFSPLNSKVFPFPFTLPSTFVQLAAQVLSPTWSGGS